MIRQAIKDVLGTSQNQGSSAPSQSDTASISPQAAALLQAEQNGGVQGGGHHHHHHQKLTDDQAAKVGAAIQKQEPNLFKQLDQNGDGNLTSDELKAGIDKLRQQSSSDAQSAPASTQTNTSPLGVIRQAIKDVLSASQGQSQGSSTGDVDNDGDSH